MDLQRLASTLLGKKRAETNNVMTDATTRTYVGTATSASEDGSVYVALSQDVTLPDDDDGEHGVGVEMPTTVGVAEGDEVLVTLMGGGTMKSPVVTGNPGWGDSIQTQVDDAETLAQQAEAEVEQVRQDVADFRDDVATTYATKVEREDGDDAVKTWVTTNYTNSNDLATTYATKTLVSQTKDAIELAASQTYETQSDAAATYATKSALTVGLDGIRSEVAEDYQPKGDYATTASMNSAIQQSASSIESSVAATYETKSDASTTYATKTEVNQTASALDTRITTAQSTADGAYLERTSTGTTIDTTGAATIRSLVVEGQSVQDGTPTPSAPVEIQSVELENLLDESTFNAGVYSINSDGSLHVSGADGRAWASWTPNTVELDSANTSYYWTSDVPIYVQIGTTSVRSSINGATSGFVNSNGASKLMVKVLAPTGKTYPFDVRFSLTAYPVRYPLSFDSVIQHVAVGINALPSGTDFTQLNSAGGVTVTRTGGVYTFNGTPQSTGGRLDTIYLINAFRVPAGTYRATAFYSGSGALTMHVQKNNGNNTYTILQSTGTFSSSGTYPTNAFEVSDGDCLFIGFNIATSGAAYNSTAKVMLTRGTDVPTEYVPFQGTATPIDLQGHALRSLPDGTRDEMAVDSLGRVTMTQRVGVVDLGTLAYTYRTSGSVSIFSTSIGQMRVSDTPSNLMCTAYEPRNTTGFGLADGQCTRANNSRDFYVRDTAYTDAATFKSAVAGTTVLYPLATPQTIDLGTIDLPAPADTLWLDAAIVPTMGATWWTVDGIAGQQALDAEVTERQTLIRQFSGGVLAGYVGNAIAALVNAAGSFDVVRTAWANGVPSILGTLATFGANLIRIGEETGQNVLITSAGQLFRDGLNNLLALLGGTEHTETFTIESYVYDPTYSYMATHTIGVEHIAIQSVTFDGSEFPRFSATTRRGWVYKKSTNVLSLRFHQSDSALGKQVTVNYRTFASMAIYDGTGNDAENIAASFSADDIMLGGSIDGDVDDDKASIRFFGGSVDTETTYIDASGGIGTSSITGDPCYLNREIALGNIVTDSRLYDDSGRRANGFVSFAQSISDSYNTGGETTSSYVNSYVSMYSGTNNVANYAAITATSVDNLLDNTTSDTETYTEVSARADRIRLEHSGGDATVPMEQAIVALQQPYAMFVGSSGTTTATANGWRITWFNSVYSHSPNWSDYFSFSNGVITARQNIQLEISGCMNWTDSVSGIRGFGVFVNSSTAGSGTEYSEFQSFPNTVNTRKSVWLTGLVLSLNAGVQCAVGRYEQTNAVYVNGANFSRIELKVLGTF